MQILTKNLIRGGEDNYKVKKLADDSKLKLEGLLLDFIGSKYVCRTN